MDTTPKSGNYLDFEKDLPRTRAIDNLRKFSVGFKEFVVIIFFLAFLAALVYWLYQLGVVESTNFNSQYANPQTAIADIAEKGEIIARATLHMQAAFQGMVAAFFTLILLVYIL